MIEREGKRGEDGGKMRRREGSEMRKRRIGKVVKMMKKVKRKWG